MRGPNMWESSKHQLIILKLNFSGFSDSQLSTACIRLQKGFPDILGSEPGDESVRLKITRAIALIATTIQPEPKELHTDNKLMGKDSYYAIFGYGEEEAGVEAAHLACDIVEDIVNEKVPLFIDEARNRIRNIYEEVYLGPSTNAIVQAATKRGIPSKKIRGGQYVIFGQGKFQKKIEASISETTSHISVDIAGDKETTKQLLADALLPVPKGDLIQKESSLQEIVEELGFPLVTKPLDGHQGQGITSDITNSQTLLKGFRAAKEFSRHVIVERHIKGNDYRFLVIGYKLVAVAKRTPACVTGDGESSIRSLIDKVNSDPKHGSGHGNVLTKIEADVNTIDLLASINLTLDSIPAIGETVYLKDTANLSTGGTAVDVTDEVHPENVMIAERAARIIGLDICGIDIMAPDVTTPITENGGAILEVNAAPGLRMHIAPSEGKSRDVGNAIVDLLYREDEQSRVPIVAITGTNGKTTTSRLMSYVADKEGYNVGFTTTDGIYVKDKQIVKGDCTGPKSSKVVLQEPSVDFAVLECARGGLIRSGLAFDFSDIAIVTNVAADHLGQKDIYTIEDLANVKSVVPKSVKPDGYAMLNAADDLVYNMKNSLSCKLGLFALEENDRIKEHCAKGGISSFLDNSGNVVIRKGDSRIVIENVSKIPLTMEGRADFMTENVLPVAMTAYVLGFSLETLRSSLRNFKPSADQTPGRLNKFEINDVNVIVDYAHNPHGLKAIGRLLKQIETQKIGIITGVGDRRDEDIIELGRIAAEMYDEVIIRTDKDTRGRSPNEIAALLITGLKQVNNTIPNYFIPDSKEALRFAIKDADKGAYIIISADKVNETLEIMKELENEFEYEKK